MNADAWLIHEVALQVIARLLVEADGGDSVDARVRAAGMMNRAMREHVARDAALRQIGRDIAREHGFPDYDHTPP